jgi:hypothetical protein
MNQKLRSFLLWISVPLCIALAVTGLSFFWPGIYWREKPASVVGALVSDFLDLFLILPALVVTTVLARRGSLCALLVWAGVLGYLCYNFPIYVFDVHFNAMFPAYCVVMGLSFYGLLGLREVLVPGEVAKTYGPGAPRRSIAAAFVLLVLLTAAHELQEIVQAIRAGQIPAGAAAAGQLTDPIHVLDLCFLLPALAIAAVMLLRRKEMGFTLAPVLSVVLILISIEVIGMIVVPVVKGAASDLTPAISFAVPGTLFSVLLVWYFYPKRKAAERA